MTIRRQSGFPQAQHDTPGRERQTCQAHSTDAFRWHFLLTAMGKWNGQQGAFQSIPQRYRLCTAFERTDLIWHILLS